MTEPTPNRRIRFNPEISMGHVIQAICIVCAVIAAYFTLDKRLSSLEVDNPAQKTAVQKVIQVETRLQMMEAQHKTDQEGLKSDLRRIEDKLDRLIERQQ